MLDMPMLFLCKQKRDKDTLREDWQEEVALGRDEIVHWRSPTFRICNMLV